LNVNEHWCVFVFSYAEKDNIRLSGFTIQNARQWNNGAAGIFIFTDNANSDELGDKARI